MIEHEVAVRLADPAPCRIWYIDILYVTGVIGSEIWISSRLSLTKMFARLTCL
jgi:hypothetical protein